MPMPSLTKKLCLLLVTCGFLRPDDLLCTDARASHIVDGNLELEVLFPKEMGRGQTIIKPVVIRSHPDEALCSHRRTQDGGSAVAHPKNPARFYTPVVRHIQRKRVAIGTDRISSHIQEIMQLAPGNENEPPFYRDYLQKSAQAIRSVNKSIPPNAVPSATPDEIYHVDTHPDPETQKEIVLWDDIFQAFKNAELVRGLSRSRKAEIS
ncbi:hypothetical protein BGX30_006873 [Mortierella sp. GBA39]|nr:hypothetical protein BGX30_006873 [Mortierella sp. GBA39]